mmetsp:Transcript_42953/g.86184  ORF Transcript_42953/g.86184 Transcript_42953/m.86184 type:complete len:242 (-) Transcript_42953:44-769(-)
MMKPGSAMMNSAPSLRRMALVSITVGEPLSIVPNPRVWRWLSESLRPPLPFCCPPSPPSPSRVKLATRVNILLKHPRFPGSESSPLVGSVSRCASVACPLREVSSCFSSWGFCWLCSSCCTITPSSEPLSRTATTSEASSESCCMLRTSVSASLGSTTNGSQRATRDAPSFASCSGLRNARSPEARFPLDPTEVCLSDELTSLACVLSAFSSPANRFEMALSEFLHILCRSSGSHASDSRA